MTHVTRQSATNAVFAIGLALGTNLLPAVVDDAALAKDSPAATPLAIEQSIVALPTLLIPAGGKAVFTLDTTDREAMPEVLLRLEAFIPFGQDAGYEITQSRQLLLSYDFATDTASEPVWVEPSRPEYGSWEGGVQSWRGQLWVMHMDVWTEKDVRRTKIVLRTFAEGKFGEPIAYDNCPTVYPYGPSISVYDDQLVLLFSDLAATEQNRNREPLLYSVFDGHRFSDARVLHDLGRNRYAKGVQVGDRFVCAFKCSSPYFEKHGYQYHDIALSTFRPGSEKPVQTTMYVTDRKYNSSPDVALHDGSVFVVYNKFEHLYGQSDNPAVNYDDFIGWLLPVVPGNTDSPRNHTNTTPTSPDPSRQDSNSR